MKALKIKTTWSALLSGALLFIAVPLSGCYTVLQQSGSYYSEFGGTAQSEEGTDDAVEADSIEDQTEYAEQDDGTVIINRYYDGPWYDSYYPYRWGVGFGYASWPYYGYVGWPYYGVYYNPWWNDYYYTGWCYYPRDYYGDHNPHYGWNDGGGVRRSYTGRRTNLGGLNGGYAGGNSYGAAGSSVRSVSDKSGTSSRNESGVKKSSVRKSGGSKNAVRGSQKQTRVKGDGRRQNGGSKETRETPKETRRNRGSDGGSRRNKDNNDSGRRSFRFTTNSGYSGFGLSSGVGTHQRSSTGMINLGNRTGFSTNSRSNSGSRTNSSTARTQR